MAHLVIPILVSVLLIGTLGSVFLGIFFNQTISDSNTKTVYIVIPIIGLTFLAIFIIREAASDRD